MRKLFLWEEDERERDVLIALLEDEYRVVEIRGDCGSMLPLRNDSRDLIVLGIAAEEMGKGLRAIKRLRCAAPSTPILCRIPHGDPEVPTVLLRHGVSACVSRDCSQEELKSWLRKVRSPRPSHLSVSETAPVFRGIHPGPLVLLGESDCMRFVRSQIQLYARYSFPVLLTGECGTGKELAAKSIHRLSLRSTFPFVAINCGAIPETILESELFGTEKGAYTGAVSRPGAFESADDGTLFLDEITELASGAQAKLLRALEGGEVRRLGARRTTRCDVRLISATNANLEVKEDFRYDLLERLETLVLELPPLRERLEDIPVLSQHFLVCCSLDAVLSEAALRKLTDYDWPGNVRQLRNTVVRAAVSAAGDASEAPARIGPEHIVFGTRPVGC